MPVLFLQTKPNGNESKQVSQAWPGLVADIHPSGPAPALLNSGFFED